MQSIQDLTDEQLISACELPRWIKFTSGYSGFLLLFFFSLVGGVIGSMVGIDLGAPNSLIAIACIVGLLISSSVLGKEAYKQRKHLDLLHGEVAKRYSPPLEEAVLAAKNSFQDKCPPEWVLLFQACALPDGTRYSVRVDLWDTEPRLTSIDARVLHGCWEDSPRDRVRKKNHELCEEPRARLVELLTDMSLPEEHRIGADFVFDGLPCTTVVLRRDVAGTTTICGNLAGASARESRAELPRALMGLATVVLEQRAFMGAYLPGKGIRLGSVG